MQGRRTPLSMAADQSAQLSPDCRLEQLLEVPLLARRPRNRCLRGDCLAVVALRLVHRASACDPAGRRSKKPGSRSPPGYVGSPACAKCHETESAAWSGSQHRLAMQAPTEQSVLGRLQRRELRALRRHEHVLPPRRKIHGAHRWPGRKARGLRGTAHLRGVPAAAVPAGHRRRTTAGAVDRLGLTAAGRRWPALVSPLSRRAHRPRGRAPLDETATELELHVRGLPRDRPAEELRRGYGHVCDPVGRADRGLRGLPWARLGACRVGRSGRKWRHDREVERPHRALRRTPRRAVENRPGNRQRNPQPHPRCRHGNRRLRAVPLATRPVLQRLPRRGETRGSLHPGAAHARPLLPGRPAARRGLQLGLVPVEPHVLEGRDLRRLPRTARREAARRGQRGLRPVSPCFEDSTRPRTISTRRVHPGRNAPPATCRPRPTWSWTLATTTASASRART